MSGIGLEIIAIFLLILLNGFFAMSEAAVIASRKARLQQRVNEGDRKAQAALGLAENLARFLPTVQVGITLIGVLAGAVGGATIAEALAAELAKVPALALYAESIALTVVVVLITFFSMLLGELVPKRLALQRPERIASRVAGVMRLISRLFSPVVWVLGRSTDLVLRALGVKQTTEPPVTEEEILVQMDQGTQAGIFQEAEQDMVEGIFSLSDQRVNALMTPRNEIVWLDLHDTPAQIRSKVEQSPFSRFPVGDDSLDHAVGIARAKDLLLADLKKGEQLRTIARPPLFIPETAFGSRALEMFRESKREMMLVVDEFGVVQGLLTLADVLEEIVGELGDKPRATQRQDGSWLLDGMLPNDEFKEIFNLRHLPAEEEYETLGGLVMMQLGRIPQPADHFEWSGLRFEVMDMDGHRVDKVLVTTLPVRQNGKPDE
jgi:putative hemolysin